MCFSHLSHDIIHWWTRQFVHLATPQRDSPKGPTHDYNLQNLLLEYMDFYEEFDYDYVLPEKFTTAMSEMVLAFSLIA